MTKSLFQQLLVSGEAGIKSLVDTNAQETLQLDFKEKRNRLCGSFEKDDKRAFGRALSAFSNSAGGLVIWGVEGRKNEDGVDCALSLKPIQELDRFYSEANRLVGELIMPKHDGIFVEKINCIDYENSGYLIVWIERSERRPHRSEAQGEKYYFKRAGESSFPMEHYDIEDAFKRRVIPSIKIGYRYQTTVSDGLGRPVSGVLEIFINNESTVTAKMPYIQIRDVSGASGVDRRIERINISSQGAWTCHAGDVSAAVHPGIDMVMVKYLLNFDYNTTGTINGIPEASWVFSAICRFGCEDVGFIEKDIFVDGRMLARMMSDGNTTVL